MLPLLASGVAAPAPTPRNSTRGITTRRSRRAVAVPAPVTSWDSAEAMRGAAMASARTDLRSREFFTTLPSRREKPVWPQHFEYFGHFYSGADGTEGHILLQARIREKVTISKHLRPLIPPAVEVYGRAVAKKAQVFGGRAVPELLGNRCDNGSAPADLTSPSEKLVCRSFTLGRLISTSRAKRLKWLRSGQTTCSSKVPEPLM